MQNQHHPNQHQQHGQKQTKDWSPGKDTLILVIASPLFEPRARVWWHGKYGRQWVDPANGKTRAWAINTVVNALRLSERHEVVCLYENPAAPVKGPDGFRARVASDGPLPVLMTAPVQCADHWREGADNDGGLDAASLCRAITRGFQSSADVAGPARAHITDRDAQLTISLEST